MSKSKENGSSPPDEKGANKKKGEAKSSKVCLPPSIARPCSLMTRKKRPLDGSTGTEHDAKRPKPVIPVSCEPFYQLTLSFQTAGKALGRQRRFSVFNGTDSLRNRIEERTETSGSFPVKRTPTRSQEEQRFYSQEAADGCQGSVLARKTQGGREGQEAPGEDEGRRLCLQGCALLLSDGTMT